MKTADIPSVPHNCPGPGWGRGEDEARGTLVLAGGRALGRRERRDGERVGDEEGRKGYLCPGKGGEGRVPCPGQLKGGVPCPGKEKGREKEGHPYPGLGYPLPPCGWIDTSENITFPHTSECGR